MAVRGSSRVPDWIAPLLAKADGGRLREGPEWAYEYELGGTSQVRGFLEGNPVEPAAMTAGLWRQHARSPARTKS